MEDIFRKATDHAKEAQLSLMEDSSSTKRTTHEHGKGFRCILVEFLQVLQNIFQVRLENFKFRFFKNQGRDSREQDRGCKDRLDSERRSRVCILVPSKSRWKNRKQGFNVRGDTILNMGKISMNTSDDTNMLCVVNKLDGDIVDLNTGDSLGVVD